MSAHASRVRHPEWSRHAAVYQLNTRQFTDEGTFAAAATHLTRLQDLGVGVIWLMPVHEIGELHRKGTLGSPYAVKDFYSVNHELGTIDDLKDFVATAHRLGMQVIVDWIANHTAWDNPLVREHPEWYQRDWKGEFRPTPWWDWTDIIDLDYRQPGLREFMIEAMVYWVERADIDGFRCDVAGFVPVDFWVAARRALDRTKPVFMLAEWESRDLHVEAFDATYAWSWYRAMREIATGRARSISPLFVYYSSNEGAYPADAMRLTFVSNHDKNAWDGTEFEQFGAALEPAMVLSVVGEGLPLIYSGQEAGNPKRLPLFDRDPIEWRPHRNGELYRQLFALKRDHPALWNAGWGARMIAVPNTSASRVLSFVRQRDDDRVFAVINFSAAPHAVEFDDGPHRGEFTEAFTRERVTIAASTRLELGPWSYRVFTS